MIQDEAQDTLIVSVTGVSRHKCPELNDRQIRFNDAMPNA